jgi:hypothetical protein
MTAAGFGATGEGGGGIQTIDILLFFAAQERRGLPSKIYGKCIILAFQSVLFGNFGNWKVNLKSNISILIFIKRKYPCILFYAVTTYSLRPNACGALIFRVLSLNLITSFLELKKLTKK